MKENPAGFERFGAHWTPTLVFLAADGDERHRFEGYLPADEFLAQLKLAAGHIAFADKDWKKAERHFEDVVRESSATDAAPAAAYWAGVTRYKATGDATALREADARLRKQFPQSTWAKKSSVWAA